MNKPLATHHWKKSEMLNQTWWSSWQMKPNSNLKLKRNLKKLSNRNTGLMFSISCYIFDYVFPALKYFWVRMPINITHVYSTHLCIYLSVFLVLGIVIPPVPNIHICMYELYACILVWWKDRKLWINAINNIFNSYIFLFLSLK